VGSYGVLWSGSAFKFPELVSINVFSQLRITTSKRGKGQ